MKISILTSESEDLNTIETSSSITIQELKVIVESMTKIPINEQCIVYNGNEIKDNKKTLGQCNVTENDIIQVIKRRLVQQNKYEALRKELLSNKYQFNQLKMVYPQLENLLDKPVEFENELKRIEEKNEEIKRKKIEEMKFIYNNPFDVEAQKKIESEIKKQNINQNFEYAIEHHPEFYGEVTMLYINCELNDKPVKAFVDSGAQKTIMSPQLAEQVGITHLIDDRFTGVAKGVGVARILGIIHNAKLKIGNNYFTTTISVVEKQELDLILGLDMLKRHQVILDLKDNLLRIGDEKVPFLAEFEIPKKKKVMNEKEISELEKGKEKVKEQPIPGFSNSASSSARYPESTIQDLMSLGFTRTEVISALDASSGDPSIAASLLF